MLGQPFGLGFPPCSDGRVIAGQQNLRYLAAFPQGGLRELGGLKQTPIADGKGFLGQRILIPQHARYKPDRRVDQDLSRDLAAGQDIIADADLLDIMGVEDALVHPLETPADQRDALAFGKLAGAGLGQRAAARREIDHRQIAPRRAQGRVHHIGANHHARATARRRVIDIAMPADAEIAQGNAAQLP